MKNIHNKIILIEIEHTDIDHSSSLIKFQIFLKYLSIIIITMFDV